MHKDKAPLPHTKSYCYGAAYVKKYESDRSRILQYNTTQISGAESVAKRIAKIQSVALRRQKEVADLESQMKFMTEMERQTLNVMSNIDKLSNKIQRLELVLLRSLADKEKKEVQSQHKEMNRRLYDYSAQKTVMRRNIMSKSKKNNVLQVEVLRESSKGTKW
eukprot:CAMPEP_0184482092 /NCGR_PEP_ID=MMETSP0113_2-20130426/3661_1 /TAXON_ID=91329 /ORGANISM="Norrisiella sphaerica, Strain BC52" /LENGTH=162 /DNA_ID=CAMNT_0026861627 /DNA_START=62 /DNA_END=547 /DNA_ORIENTATION=-